MTTSEFIKLLQKEDPKGTSHIRMSGGVPTFFELKEGYWDGPYDYINEEGKWVHTTKNNKVDIHIIEPEDIVTNYIDKNFNTYTDSPDGLWEKIKDQFVFEITYLDPRQRQERIDSFMKPIKEHYDDWITYIIDKDNKVLEEVINLNKRGCRFFRKKETEYKYYTGWEFINENNPKDIGCANLYHTKPILTSNKFKPVDTNYFPNDEYFEYILINE